MAAGFRGVEYQFPYAAGSAEQVARWASEAGVTVVLHNLPAGDAGKGERGIACLPGRGDEFRAGVERGVAYARAVQCRRLNCLAGIAPPEIARERALQTLRENLAWAAARLAGEGIDLLLEPVSQVAVPGFLLSTSREAMAVVEAVGAPNLRLQYDVYHMQLTEGNLAQTLERLRPRIGHVQIADVPGRHEPGTGEIRFDFLLAHLDRIGYDGWVGCEYNPIGGTVQGLQWAQRWLTKA